VEHSCLEGCSQQIVGSRERMDIARKMEIEFLHRYYLGVSSPCRASLNSKRGTLARLSNDRHHFAIEVGTERLAQAHCGR
jgi:hypothetical protein